MKLLNLCQKAITINEIGHDATLAYKFSDPDGTQSGKSGYSYGASQFDIENNWDAIKTLEHCGMRPKDLDRLFEQRGDISDLNEKLLANRDQVDAADLIHINHAVDHVFKYCGDRMSQETLVHLVDYHNQFYITPGGLMHTYVLEIIENRPLKPSDVLWLKLNKTAWGKPVHLGGKGRGDDVQRRFDNIEELCKTA